MSLDLRVLLESSASEPGTAYSGDTHRGILADTGIVTADCGIHFPPQRLAIRDIAFRGYPPDPDQVCPQCKAVPAPTPRART